MSDVSTDVPAAEASSDGQDHVENAILGSQESNSKTENEMSGTESRDNNIQPVNDDPISASEEPSKGSLAKISSNGEEADKKETECEVATSQAVESESADATNKKGAGNAEKDDELSFDGIIDEINELLE